MVIKARVHNIKKVKNIVVILEGESLDLIEKIFALVWDSLICDHTIEKKLGIKPNQIKPNQPTKLYHKWYGVHWPSPKLAMRLLISEIKTKGKYDLPSGEITFTFIAKENPSLARLELRRKK